MSKKHDKTTPLSAKLNFIWNTTGSLIYLGCQWLTTVLVVVLSHDYTNSGILAFAMATGVLFASIGLFGMKPVLVSDIDHKFSYQNYVAFRILTNLFGATFCVLYSLFMCSDMPQLMVSLAYLLFKIDECLCDVLYGIEQANYRMDYIGISMTIRGPVSLTLFCLGLTSLNSLLFAILLMWAGCFITTLAYDIPRARLFGKILPHIDVSTFKELFRETFFSMATNAVIVYMVSGVRQIYGNLSGSEMLGIYAAIATPAVLVQVAANYLYAPILRDIAIWHRESLVSFRHKFNKLFLLVVVAIIALMLVLIPIGNVCLPIIYGDSINEFMYTFPFVLVATGAVGLINLFYNAFVVLREKKKLIFIVAIGTILTYCLCYPLISVAGMNGVNICIIVGNLSASVIGYILIIIK